MLYLVDAEEKTKEVSYPGTVEAKGSDLIHHLSKTYSKGRFISDQYGVWMTGYAPVYDKHGNYAGTVGADLSIATYHNDLKWFMELFVYSIAGAVVLSVMRGSFSF